MDIRFGYLLPFAAIPLWLAAGIAHAECASPAFVTSDPNGGWSNGGYYLHNNMWNNEEVLGPETLTACSYHDWYVVSNQSDVGTNSVKTYPNVHKDYDKTPISSFQYLTSTFAATAPQVGIYDVAFDIWLNGVATSSSNEVMIWTENHNQVPAGTKTDTVTLGGHKFNVWKIAGNSYIAFVPTSVMSSGSIDLLGIFNWLIGKGWIPTTSTLGQICFGVEIVNTNGAEAKFTFSDFSINTTPPNGIMEKSPFKSSQKSRSAYYTLTGKRLHRPPRPQSIKLN
jgi:hypothetical protein